MTAHTLAQVGVSTRVLTAARAAGPAPHTPTPRDFFTDNLLVRIRLIIEMIWWTGLAPWDFTFPCPSNTSRPAGIDMSLPNNQRLHRTLHIQKDVLPYASGEMTPIASIAEQAIVP